MCGCVSLRPVKTRPLQVRSYDRVVFTWAVPMPRALPAILTHACSFGQQRWSHMCISGLLTGQSLFPASLNSLAYFIHVVPQLIFLKINLFIHLFILFLAALGLRCCTRAFCSCGERGLLFIVVRGLLIMVASLVAEHGL